ncbi:MAG: class I SAM-dependent methyltransferase [Bacteroidia bacterium]|nr:class I SAM-dependent methyltransferase [Bacteroidia bacterium]
MNEKLHWDKIGSNYNNEIFDVFRSDKKRKLRFYFSKHAGKNKNVIDFGCGNGKSFSYLSPLFDKILAIDISQKLLNQARQQPFQNVSFRRMDLSRRGITLPPSDFLFCCNVVMLPALEKNIAMLKNISRALKRGATAVVVLPSIESAFFSSWRLIDWYKREGVKPEEIDKDELHYFKGKKTDIIQGIVYIDNVPTKHYSASELDVLFTQAGLKITALDKVEYDWDSELESPPKWMKSPYPWDWLVECKNG